MSKKAMRGGTIFIDKDGKKSQLRPPTKMAAAEAKKDPQKSNSKTSKKGEK